MKRIGLLALAVVLSLGLVGAGFAYWTETLNIDADVDTGELAVGLRWYHAFEKSPHVGLSPRAVYWQSPGVHEHTFYLTNVYPSFGSGCLPDQQFFCAVYFMTNEGTIPVKVEAINITKPDWIEVVTYGSHVPQDMKDKTIAQIQASTDIPDDEKQAMIQAVDADWHVGQIIYPRPHGIAHTWAWIAITLHILESAPEGGSGTVTVETIFTQFNDEG